MKSSHKTITIDSNLLKKINSAIEAALAYEKATDNNRKLGITGEVGEVWSDPHRLDTKYL